MVRCKISEFLTMELSFWAWHNFKSVDSLDPGECFLMPVVVTALVAPVIQVNSHQNHKQIVTHVNHFNIKITVRHCWHLTRYIVNIYFWQLTVSAAGPSFWGNRPRHTILWLNSNLGNIPRKSNRPDNWVGTHGTMESIRGELSSDVLAGPFITWGLSLSW